MCGMLCRGGVFCRGVKFIHPDNALTVIYAIMMGRRCLLSCLRLFLLDLFHIFIVQRIIF